MDNCPYKGLLPYTEQDTRYFFGRDIERRVISDNLRAARLTVLYGESGVGKSSVLGAGVVHDLRDDPDYNVVVFRTWRDDPVAGLGSTILELFARADSSLGGAPLSEGLGLLAAVQSYKKWTDRTLLVILDQFEEYFQYHHQEDGEGSFFVEFPRLLYREGLPIHFLVSIRQDSLAALDRFKRNIPGLFDNRLSIDFLSPMAAKDAILKPIEKFNEEVQVKNIPFEPIKISEDLAINVVEEIISAQGDGRNRVQTPYLQLVMTRWWEKEAEARSGEMRRQTLDELGGVKKIVDEHLEKTIRDLGSGRQDDVARIFAPMVTSAGRKIAQTVTELIGSTDLTEDAVVDILEKLLKGRILAAVPPPRGSPPEEKCYEFAHDVVAKAALEWLGKRRQAQKAEAAEYEAAQAKLRAEGERKRADEQARQAIKFRRLAWALGALVLAAAVAIAFALLLWKNAREAQRTATVRELVSSSVLSLEEDPERGLLLAMHAVATTWSSTHTVLPEAEDQLHRAIASSRIRRTLLTLSGHSDVVTCVAWSPDGKRLATGSHDETAKVWDAASGKELLSLSGHSRSSLVVSSVAWSPDGKRLATGSWDNTAKVWDAATGQKLQSLSGHSDVVTSVAWSPDGKRLATGSWDNTAKVWDAATGKELQSLSGHSDEVLSVAWSPDGKRLATGSLDETAKVWDAATGKELQSLSGHSKGISSVAWSPDGRRLATPDEVWDAATGKELLSLSGRESVAWSPDGRRLATGNHDMTAKVWDAATGTELLSLPGHGDSVLSVAWSPDGMRLATLSGDKTAKLWDAATGNELLSLSGHRGQVHSVAWSLDGKRLATGSDDKTAKVWDAATGKELLSLPPQRGGVNSVAWSPDGKWLATGSVDDKTAKVWDATSGKELLSLSGHVGEVFAVAWSPDGKWLATGSWDETAKVWDAATGKELLSLPHRGQVLSVAWSPDGKRLATGSEDKTAKVWDAAPGNEPLSLSGHSDNAESVAWSPDGKRLATGSWDKTVKLWDTATGKELLTLSGHSGGVYGVAWSPDGKRLATASEDEIVQVYAMDIDLLMALARERVTRNLTTGECKKYLHVGICPPIP
jgi:WD40 repeat protein